MTAPAASPDGDRDRPRIGLAYFADPDERKPFRRAFLDDLREWADLVVLDPGREHPDLASMGLDCYHMMWWSEPALADLERAEAAGLPTVNSYEGSRVTTDRLATYERLASGDLHLPAVEYGTAAEITLRPPVVVKPRYELDAEGHEFELVFAGPIEFEGERIVERYVVPQRSYKVFRAGSAVRTVRYRRALGALVPGRPAHEAVETPTPDRFAHLTDVVGDLFDLALFELDIVVHKGVYVIDVNPVVSLEGVADGADCYERLLREMLAEPPRRTQ